MHSCFQLTTAEQGCAHSVVFFDPIEWHGSIEIYPGPSCDDRVSQGHLAWSEFGVGDSVPRLGVVGCWTTGLADQSGVGPQNR
jgi:hypothetical protein